MMQPQLIERPPQRLIGIHTEMSLRDNQTRALWQQFRPRVAEIAPRIDRDYYSVNVYSPGLQMTAFTPATLFEKWAAVAVAPEASVPLDMDTLVLPAGLYAVFVHRGPAHTFAKTWQQIFGVWLPTSGFQLADRPHFERLGPAYRPDDPHAEETVWIPLAQKP